MVDCSGINLPGKRGPGPSSSSRSWHLASCRCTDSWIHASVILHQCTHLDRTHGFILHASCMQGCTHCVCTNAYRDLPNIPALHFVHTDASPSAYVPSRHFVQLLVPSEYVPGRHEMHFSLCWRLKPLPGQHRLQSLASLKRSAPVLLSCPACHVCSSSSEQFWVVQAPAPYAS